MNEQNITISGRTFRAVTGTNLAQDRAAIDLAAKLGVDNWKLEPGETPGAFGLRILDQAIESGAAWPLLGVLIVPADVPDGHWTPEMAAATAEFLRAAQDPDDKRVIAGLLSSVLIGLFQGGAKQEIPA